MVAFSYTKGIQLTVAHSSGRCSDLTQLLALFLYIYISISYSLCYNYSTNLWRNSRYSFHMCCGIVFLVHAWGQASREPGEGWMAIGICSVCQWPGLRCVRRVIGQTQGRGGPGYRGTRYASNSTDRWTLGTRTGHWSATSLGIYMVDIATNT